MRRALPLIFTEAETIETRHSTEETVEEEEGVDVFLLPVERPICIESVKNLLIDIKV